MPEAQGGTASRSERAVGGVAFVVLFVVLLWFPWPYHERLLDDGWSLALGEFMRTRARAGVDYVFPYGPLGYLAVPALVPELFGLKYAWSILLAAVSAAALVRAATRLPQLSARAGWLWLAVVFLPRTENRFIVMMVVIAVLHVVEESWTTGRVLLTTAFLAAVALVKFSFFVLALALMSFLCIAAPRRVRVLLGGSYLAALAVFWLVSGQSLFDLPRYVSRSFELVTGYSEAMSLSGDRLQLILACLVVALLISGVAISRPQRRSWPALGMLISGAGLVWKECFVRQDAHHSVWFFGYAALASVLFHALPRGAAGTKRGLGLALMAGVPIIAVAVQARTEKDSIASFLVRAKTWGDARDAVGILLAPRRYVASSMPAVQKGATEWSLPEVARRIGTEPMDVVTVDQAVALYNGFNFRPRPVFQSYSAYTPTLAELNGEFINGPRAPRFVLSRWTSIDRRFPPADDPLTLLGLLQRYRPVLRERDYVLLERHESESSSRDRGTVVLNLRTQRGVRVALPTEDKALYTLAIVVRPTVAARLARLVYGAPRLPFVVELENGTQHSYELVSAVAAVPFVISPVLDESGDLSSLYEARGARTVAVMIAKHGDGSLKYFADDIEVRLVRYRWPPDHGGS